MSGHIVIDSTALDALLAAGDLQNRTLGNVPCICVYERPYHPRGKLVTQCGCCRAIAEWKCQRAAAERAVKVAS